MSGRDPKPAKKTCGAKTSHGPCRAQPAKGKDRCRFHGGAERIGRPPIHGRYSERFKRIEPVAQAAIDQAIADPGLLDVKRPVALQAAIVQEAAIVPTEDIVRAWAMKLSRWRPGKDQTWDEQPEPSSAELELARMSWLERSANLIDLFGDTLARSAKTIAVTEALTKQIVPIFAELGGRLTKLSARFVAPDKREDFEAAFRMEVRSVVAAVLTLADE